MIVVNVGGSRVDRRICQKNESNICICIITDQTISNNFLTNSIQTIIRMFDYNRIDNILRKSYAYSVDQYL